MAESTQGDYECLQRRARKAYRLAGCLAAALGATERSRRLRSSFLRRIEWQMGARKHPVQVPVIKTDRLMLRGFRPGDTNQLAALLGDPAVMCYMPARRPLSRKQAAASLRRISMCWYQHGRGRWGVICNEDSRLIGWSGLEYLPEVDETEVLYLFDPAYWGQGYATEAAAASLRWGFEELQLDRIIGVAFSENAASRRTCEILGAEMIEIVDLPADSDMYAKGERRKCRYRLDLLPAGATGQTAS